MALERKDLSQIASLAPPLPRRAFTITGQGTTSTSETWGGSGTDGKLYGYVTLDTTWWTASQGTAGNLNLLPVPVGVQFQVYSRSSGFSPASGLLNSQGAPDLLGMADWLAAYTLKDAQLRTVVGIRQQSANSWNVYYSPSSDSATADGPYTPGTDGIVTWPRPYNPQWFGAIGHVTGQVLQWDKPGGPTSLSFSLSCPPELRTTAMTAGRVLQVFRGGSCTWEGVLQEPQPSPTGWTITATGAGTYGDGYAAYYTQWVPDNPVNEAIGRGLRWRNDGIGSPPGLFGLNSGNAQDSGSLTVTDFLNLLTSTGALFWSVEPPLTVGLPAEPWVLRMRPFPVDISGNPLTAGTTLPQQYNIQEFQRIDLNKVAQRVPPDLYIVNSNPVPRTQNGLYNTLVCRYQATPDIPAISGTAAVAATFNEVFVDQPSSVAEQQRVEFFLDMTSAGVMTAAQVQEIAQAILARYVQLSYATAYTVYPGQLLNNGGEPVDLALDWSGKMATVLVENAPVGGSVTYGPTTFFVGTYSYDDDSQTGTLTPLQQGGTDISSILSELTSTSFP